MAKSPSINAGHTDLMAEIAVLRVSVEARIKKAKKPEEIIAACPIINALIEAIRVMVEAHAEANDPFYIGDKF